MTFKMTLIVGALAATLVAGSAGLAMASSSMAVEATLYSAPHGEDTDNTIDAGDDVIVKTCKQGFCLVHDLDDDDSDGWVKSATIDFIGAAQNDDDDVGAPNDNGSLVDLDLDDVGSLGHKGHGGHK
jgi:hypothetical protein